MSDADRFSPFSNGTVVEQVGLNRVEINLVERVLMSAKYETAKEATWGHGAVVHRLRAYLVALPDQVQTVTAHADATDTKIVRWPRDWRQAWKASLKGRFGEWVRRKWPVHYHEEAVTVRAVASETVEYQVYKAVCPHLRTDSPEKHLCLSWLKSVRDA